MTYNGTTISGYKNGSLFGTTASTRSFTAGSINIGKGAVSASEYFTGYIPMVQIYDRPLSDAEVSQNFNALRGRFGI
jgi:TRAP-type C4-dicarboxylate transport system substrate-binding protein